jgi:hypothetical protein
MRALEESKSSSEIDREGHSGAIQQPARQIRSRAIVAAIVTLGLGARLYGATSKNLWIDEIIRSVWAKGHELTSFFDVPSADLWARLPVLGFHEALELINIHNPPLNSMLLNAWMRWTGESGDFALRLPSMVAGTLSVLAIWAWTRAAAGETAALVAAVIVALSPYHVHLSQEVNHYALAFCLSAFASAVYHQMLGRNRLRDRISFALLSCAALFTHYFCALVLFGQWVAMIASRRTTVREAIRSSLPYAAPMGALIVYLTAFRRQLAEMTDPAIMGSEPSGHYFLAQSVKDLAYPWAGMVIEDRGVLFALPIVLVMLALCGTALRKASARDAVVLGLSAALPVVTVWLAFLLVRKNSLLWPRYHLLLAGPIIVLVAAGIAALATPLRTCAAAATLIVLADGLHWYYVSFQKEGWRPAAEVILRQSARDEPVIVTPFNTVYALAHYLPTGNRLFGAASEPGYLKQVLARAGASDSVWTVFAWDDQSPLVRTVRNALECEFQYREEYPVNAIAVARYSRQQAPAASRPTRCEGGQHNPEGGR